MKCSVKTLTKGFPVDTLVFFAPQNEAVLNKTAWKNLSPKLMTLFATIKKSGEFFGRAGEVYVYPGLTGVVEGVKRIVFVGLGEVSKEQLLPSMARAMGRLTAGLPARHIPYFGVFLDGYQFAEDAQKVADDLAAHGHLGAYRYITYKTRGLEAMRTMDEVVFVTADKKYATALSKGVKRANTVNEYVSLARDLSNESPNVASPGHIESQAKSIAKKLGMKVKVLDTAEIKKKGMNLLYNVGKAAIEGPRLVVLSYRGNPKSKDVYAMVGKGITYDTGGLSIKPSSYMRSMKTDMTGASTVFGAVSAVAALGLKVNVDAYMPLAENAIGHEAYRPDDIITAYNGMTVEIENTDAEGRLIMADTLTYACETKPKQLIDIATLTGAALVVTGGMAAPFMGTNEELVQDLKDAAKETGERIWELPLWEEANDYIKSRVADVMNCYAGGRSHPGTISAGAFLRYFVDKETPWAHIDIAGVTMSDDAVNCYTHGPSGFGVRLLTKWIENKA